MKNFFLALAVLILASAAKAQNKNDSKKSDDLLAELSGKVCQCIDSIPYSISKDAIHFRVKSCIDDAAGTYQMGHKLMNVGLSSGQTKDVTIDVNVNKDSDEYKKYYYEMESYLMGNCKALKDRMTADAHVSHSSMSDNPKAMELYQQGLDATKSEDFRKSIECYRKAVKIDPNFAYAYDNMGICYRRLEEYDKAIEAYEKSLKIDPYGTMPLQNLGIVYQRKKEYAKAIAAYERLAEIDSKNAEVYYGIGQTCVVYTGEYEKGLDNLYKAYRMYVESKSPYRSDAEKLIQYVYDEMKKQGKEAQFNEILKRHDLNPK